MSILKQGRIETIMTRIISVTFVVVALAVFKPFGLDAWQWQAYVHLVGMGVIGFLICMITDIILKYIVKMPRSFKKGAEYIIRRNLWFQYINTPLVALSICLYRHFVLSNQLEGNRLSWSNFFETLVIIAFCSFTIGLYWRFKFRSKYLAVELEETRQLNEQLQKLQQESIERTKASEPDEEEQSSSAGISRPSPVIVLTGTTNETVRLQVSDLLYIEAVGNYVKVFHIRDGEIRNDMLRATSKQIGEELQDYPMIVRSHRAFLVNLGQVERIVSKSGSMQLLIKHCHEYIPVSRSNMAQIRDAIKGDE